MELPQDLFSRGSILTLAGASGAVYVVTSAMQHALHFNPRWLALLLAVALGVIAPATTQAPTYVDYAIGLVNGCLIYCVTVGINTITARDGTGTVVPKGIGESGVASERRSFRSRWF